MIVHGSDELWNQFKSLLVNKFELEPESVRDEASFATDLGCDSLDVLELLMELEQRYQIIIPQQDAQSLSTVGSAFEYVRTRLTSP